METSHDLLNNELQISPSTQRYLLIAARWGKFLAIVGFIFCGLITTMAFFMGPLLATYMKSRSYTYTYLNPLVVTGIYIFLAIVFFFPCLYLFRFSGNVQRPDRSGFPGPCALDREAHRLVFLFGCRRRPVNLKFELLGFEKAKCRHLDSKRPVTCTFT